MNRNQSDKLSSFVKSEGLLRDNLADLAGLPEVVAKAVELRQRIEDILDLAAVIGRGNIGHTEDKRIKREALTGTLHRLARFAQMHYMLLGNAEMEAQMAKIKIGMLQNLRSADLYVLAQQTHQALLPDAAALPGSAPADMVLLASQTAIFFDAMHAPRLVRQQRSSAVAALKVVMRETEQLCQDIDVYMGTLAFSNDMLYRLWRASRNIDRTGVRQKKKKE